MRVGAPGIVGLHGFTGSPESFRAFAGEVARQRPRLVLSFPALLGHGGEDRRERLAASFFAEVDRIAAHIRATKMSGCHLLGYSLGARVALGLMARHPQLVGSATLVGVNPGLGSRRERFRRALADDVWCQRLCREPRQFARAWASQPLFAGMDERLSPAACAALSRVRASHRSAGLRACLRVLGLARMPNLSGLLSTWARPLTLVVGSRDAKFLAIGEELIGRAGARARLVVVDGAGHNVLAEAPGQLARVVLQGPADGPQSP